MNICELCRWADMKDSRPTCRYTGKRELGAVAGLVGCTAWEDFQSSLDDTPEPVPDWVGDRATLLSPKELATMHGLPVRVYRNDGWHGYGMVEVYTTPGIFKVWNPDIGYLESWLCGRYGGTPPETHADVWWARRVT